VGRETISCSANRAYPYFESEINLAIRVEHCRACLAEHWLVFNEWHVLDLFEGSVDCAHRDDDPLFIDLVAGPVVPREPNAILNLS
jgi:hypothetical protein